MTRPTWRQYTLDLQLTQAQILRFYQGSARTVVGRARSGERVSLPLSALRGFVAANGLQGTFVVQVDERNRLQEIKRLS